jgi:hypothetical protein
MVGPHCRRDGDECACSCVGGISVSKTGRSNAGRDESRQAARRSYTYGAIHQLRLTHDTAGHPDRAALLALPIRALALATRT